MFALHARDSAKYSPFEPGLRAVLSAAMSNWVDHWAMWTIAMRLQTELVSAGCTSFFHDKLPLPPDPDIQARLQSWASLTDASAIWSSFSNLRGAARSRTDTEKYRYIHGKKFWEQIMLPAPQVIENRADWMIDLAEWSPIPPDLEPLLRLALC